MAAPIPALKEGKRCFNLAPSLVPFTCTLIRDLPAEYQATVCRSRALGDAAARALCITALEHLHFPAVGANLLCNAVIGKDACCPAVLPSPPLDPPTAYDYEAGGMKPPSQYGIPTPLVGGCNCTHDEFQTEYEEEAITGNVGTYRP